MNRTLKFFVSIALSAALFFQSAFTFAPPVFAEGKSYSAQDIKALMSKLNDPGISEANKKRIAAVVFVHQDIYRDAVIRGTPGIPAKDADVDAFLRYKADLQGDVLQRMNVNERNRSGRGLSGPIIPFPYNNILSDDDIVLGSGESGKKMEALYNEALNEVVEERAKRPMTAAERARIDVNGLTWDMTQKGGLENYFHHEKYIQPQSGFANQTKLAGGSLDVYTFDPSSGMLTKLPPAEAKAALERLATDRPLDIPGIDMSRGTGAMSDYARMADIHQLRFDAPLTPANVATFIRNQKYTDRVVDDFEKLAKDANPKLAEELSGFIETSKKIRTQTNVVEVAKILEAEYKIKILDSMGGLDWKKLEEAMKIHQNRQLNVVMPKLVGAVAQNEAIKMIQWLRTDASGANRRKLRKQLALTYAPFGEGAMKSILADLDKIEAPEADKAWLKGVLENDTRQIREYARVLQIPVEELAARINMDGPSPRLVEHLENARPEVARFSGDLSARPGGGKFREFLKTKTAAALNLDKMIDGTPGEKAFQWSVVLLAMTRAYNASGSNQEGMKAMGMAAFEMIPFVAATLRFSEMEFKEAFKELAMDILPPIALAQIAVMALNYTAQTAIAGFTESVWDGLAREALKDFKKGDFEKTEAGYWRLKNRAEYLEYLEEIAPGLGRVQKLASMIEPEVDSRMSRDETVKNNEAALHTLNYLEEIDIAGIRVRYSEGFSVEDIKKRVWEKGELAPGEAKNVERVAARIILENLKIRAEHYTAALDSFIDRIENLYNEEEEDEEFDPSALVAMAQQTIKAMYENAPEMIKNDAVAAMELEAEYRKWVEFLQNYDSKGAEEMEVRRQIQGVIDEFREFIRRLAITVRLRTEMENLNLRAAVFGGEKSNVETEEVLLGDSFRIGASATVSASRGGDIWTLFYYVPSVYGDWRLLGTASPRGSASGGGEGMFVLEAASPGTVITVSRQVIEEEFSSEGGYTLLPVIAFGGWSDPLNQVGLEALQNPLEYLDVFDENRVAFTGAEGQFAVRRARVKLKLPIVVHREEEAYAEAVLDVPEYARAYPSEGEFALSSESAGPSPELETKKITAISTDPEAPSRSRILSNEKTAEGTYWVEVSARLWGFKEEHMPRPQKKPFDYTREKKDSGEEAAQALAALRGLLGRMQKLDAETQAEVDGLRAALEEILRDREGLRKALDETAAGAERLQALVDELRPRIQSAAAATDVLKRASETADRAGVSATEARANCRNHVQGLCEAASKLKSAPPERRAVLEGLVSRKLASFENQKHRFENELSKSAEAAGAAEAQAENAIALAGKQRDLSASLDRLEQTTGEAQSLLSAIRERGRGTESAAGRVQAIASEADGVHAKAAGLYAVAAQLPEAGGPWNEIEALHGGIRGRVPVAEDLARQISQQASDLDGPAAALERHQAVRDEAAAVIQELPDPAAIEEIKKSVADVKAAHDAVDMLRESMQSLVQEANRCAGGDVAPMAEPAAPVPQQASVIDPALCGATWAGNSAFDPIDPQGNPFPVDWFPPIDFTLTFDCQGGTGMIKESAFVEGRRVTQPARIVNIRTEGSTIRFTKIYDLPAKRGWDVVEGVAEFTGPDELSGQWSHPDFTAHFTAKRQK